jgi:hypothetical protein
VQRVIGRERTPSAGAFGATRLYRDGVRSIREADIGKQRVDGLELACQAVALRLSLKVIYTTGGAQTDGMAALFVEGATLSSKPYRNELIEAVKKTGIGKG